MMRRAGLSYSCVVVLVVALLLACFSGAAIAQVPLVTGVPIQLADFGGKFSKANGSPFVCGQNSQATTMVAYLDRTGGAPTLRYPFTPLNEYGFQNGSSFPVPGIGCSIAEFRGGIDYVAFNGIATSNGNGSCYESVAFATSTFYGSGRYPFDEYQMVVGYHHGASAVIPVPNEGGVVFLHSGVLGTDEILLQPCGNVVAIGGGKKRNAPGVPYGFEMIYTGSRVTQFAPMIKDFFPANSPVQGLAYGSIVVFDFDSDGKDDVFVCGTVRDMSTGQDIPYSRVFYYTAHDAPITWTPGPQVFAQVTHCVASMTRLDNTQFVEGTPQNALFLSGTDGTKRVCEMWTLVGLGNTTSFVKLAGALTEVECVTHGDVEFADMDRDGFQDMILLGDATSASGATMSGAPTAGSTVVYQYDGNSHYVPNTRLINIHSGSVMAKPPPLLGKKRAKRSPYPDVFLTGLRLYSNGNSEFGIWQYPTQELTTTFASITASTSTTAAQAAADATTTQAASLASLAAAGLLDSTTSAAATSASAAASSLTTQQATLSGSTASLATSTSTAAVSTSTQSTLTSAASTTSTRSTLVTSATSQVATSINSVVSSLTTAAATALATTTGGTNQPISADNDQQNLILPPVSAEPSPQDGSMKLTPIFSDINRDLPLVQYQIRAKRFTEQDEFGLPVSECPLPSGEFSLTTTSGRSPAGFTTTIYTFSATLCNDATVEARYTQYSGADTIEFAGVSIDVTANSIKLVYTVSGWPFESPSNFLEIEFELVLSSTPLASYIIPRDEDHYLWNLQMATSVWISSLVLRKGSIDGAATPIDIYPASTSNFLGLKFKLPYFEIGASIDPSFDVLLQGDAQKKKKSKKGVAIGGGVAGGLAFIIVVGIIVGYILFKKKSVASFGTSSGAGSGSASGGTA